MLWASIGSMRSVKNGTVWRFPNTRGASVHFNLFDDNQELRKKAQMSAASQLGKFLASHLNYVLQPLVPGKASDNYGVVAVLGDIPSLIGQPHIEKPTPFPNREGRCLIVKPEDQAGLEERAQKINNILRSLFDTDLGAVPPPEAQPNPCIDGEGKPVLPPPPPPPPTLKSLRDSVCNYGITVFQNPLQYTSERENKEHGNRSISSLTSVRLEVE
jgi:hypothetical protein